MDKSAGLPEKKGESDLLRLNSFQIQLLEDRKELGDAAGEKDHTDHFLQNLRQTVKGFHRFQLALQIRQHAAGNLALEAPDINANKLGGVLSIFFAEFLKVFVKRAPPL